ncbi:unnamed protein product [Arctia plantaginis]|uniref:Uncharacterized protein n=1 Tax=Arctia plantaginis TaxID=874455 RepID=A0A8S0ZV42_ARCPL|nr:unnamed protein product [Arctia plantaginis]
MAQCFIPVLLLATVALSSSNVLPMTMNHISKESLALNGQYNDNIFSNRYQTRNVLNEIYKLYENKPTMSKLQLTFADPDNNGEDILSIFNKNDNYNGEGFRKEQWHNYPRQLDRLHQTKEYNNEKRNFEPDPSKEQYTEEIAPGDHNVNDITNEYHLDTNTDTNDVYEAVIAANPLLILKIRLACLNKDVENANTHYANLLSSELEFNNMKDDELNAHIRNDNPAMNVIKVKREDVFSTQGGKSDNASTENKVVNKRIFSLWSRLQSLNHKGHELQHRRHLHAFYGLPDSDGGGTLTAETRATFLRPPGSPLRWG